MGISWKLIAGLIAVILGLAIIVGVFISARNRREEKKEEKELVDAVDLSKFQKYMKRDTFNAALAEWMKKNWGDPKKGTFKPPKPTPKIQNASYPLTAKIARNVYDSKDWLDDDTTKATQAFAMLPALSDLLTVNGTFENLYTEYGRDILTYCTEFMNDKELAAVYKVLNNKPEFIFK